MKRPPFRFHRAGGLLSGALALVLAIASGDGRPILAVIEPALDVDDDGEVAALTDGLLVLRFAFGFTGATLINGAVDLANCERCDATTIAQYLQSLLLDPTTCDAGTYNLDGDFENGCELDLDEQATYVSTGDAEADDDDGCGLGPAGTGAGHHPCRTIAKGVARAVMLGRAHVLVANGVYPEPVTVINGISLLGGHRADTWVRDVALTATVIGGHSSSGNHDRAVLANAVTSSTVFEGFVVHASVNTKPSGNAYAIYVSNSDADLQIMNNVIVGGRGGPGGAGVPGDDGENGPAGQGRDAGNPSAYDAKTTTGAGACDASNNRTLANGGDHTCDGDAVDGGDGGGNTCPTSASLMELSGKDGVIGQAGAASLGGAAGAGGDAGDDLKHELNPGGYPPGDYCFIPTATALGQQGLDGVDATNATAVAACVNATGLVVGGHWLGGSGTQGAAGGNGGGAGGGGGGGGAKCVGCAGGKDTLGGHGGGGGGGGCGGKGGGSASPGGGAFGIFIVGAGTAPVVTGNVITRGTGGLGGTGGAAGEAGIGGTGGNGGNAAVFCSDAGGRGGRGGDGGQGAGGGGSCGGVSYGIFSSGIGSPDYCSAAKGNTISGGGGGQGGAGGHSRGSTGGAGAAGSLGSCVSQ